MGAGGGGPGRPAGGGGRFQAPGAPGCRPAGLGLRQRRSRGGDLCRLPSALLRSCSLSRSLPASSLSALPRSSLSRLPLSFLSSLPLFTLSSLPRSRLRLRLRWCLWRSRERLRSRFFNLSRGSLSFRSSRALSSGSRPSRASLSCAALSRSLSARWRSRLRSSTALGGPGRSLPRRSRPWSSSLASSPPCQRPGLLLMLARRPPLPLAGRAGGAAVSARWGSPAVSCERLPVEDSLCLASRRVFYEC
jgi:hypothetical protein